MDKSDCIFFKEKECKALVELKCNNCKFYKNHRLFRMAWETTEKYDKHIAVVKRGN